MFGINKTHYAIIVAVIMTLLSIYHFLFAETPADKLRKLSQELSSAVSVQNSIIEGNISAAASDIVMHQKEIARLEECADVNRSTRAYNASMTVEQFLSGGIMNAVDCKSFVATASTLTSTGTATGATNPVPERISKRLAPNELFYTTAAYDKCSLSQSDSAHFKANKRHAVDIACTFGGGSAKQAVVFAPDFRDKSISYTVTSLFKSDVTGDTIDLAFEQDGTKFFWRLGHTENKLKVGQIVHTGERIGQMNLSGLTTGYHTHVELWIKSGSEYTNIDYTTRSQSVNNIAHGQLDSTIKVGDQIYVTQYNLGDVNQNDASPFIGASGKDLRHVTNPIALTSDVRKLYGIKFGDTIQLVGPCSWTYQVEDDMNSRFRTSCIRKDGACVKADIAIKPGEQKNCSGVYTITKL